MISIVGYLWEALGLYWLITGMGRKQAKKAEHPAIFALRVALLVAIFEFLFSRWGALGPLGARFVPRSAAVADLGLAIVLVGVGLAVWARHCLGGNWSSAVTLKEGHELITRGPYRWIRHPIYTGLAVGIAGTALVIGQARGLIALAAVLIGHVLKARKEEAWLRREFGEAFERHRERTGMFWPPLSRPRARAGGAQR